MIKPRVGREYQHLEDLTFIEGSQGALSAVEFLEKLAHDSSHISLKWDGGIVIYWGRDDAGDFVLTGKNGWGKSKSKSADQLTEYILTTGRGEPWRQQFAADMRKIFNILEQATPHWFRGYAKGDVLWHPGNCFQVDNDEIIFTPNQVTYCVDINSNIGRQIAHSQLGIAVHAMYLAFGSEHAEPPGLVQFLENQQIVLFSQTYIADRLPVDHTNLAAIKEKILESAANIDHVLETRRGLADIKNIIYSYVNYLVKNDMYHLVEHQFDQWLHSSALSDKKKQLIKAIREETDGFDLIFCVIKQLSMIKEKVIKWLDNCLNNEQELVRFKNANEGYVSVQHKIKLVPRTRWKPR
jgi:hypothetical protein